MSVRALLEKRRFFEQREGAACGRFRRLFAETGGVRCCFDAHVAKTTMGNGALRQRLCVSRCAAEVRS